MDNRIPINLSRICHVCGGAGKYTETTTLGSTEYDPCPICNGSGYFTLYKLVMPDEIYYSYEVFDCIKLNEYDQLNGTNKNSLAILLSLGFINLSDESKALNLLTNMFGEESDTITSITEMLNS